MKSFEPSSLITVTLTFSPTIGVPLIVVRFTDRFSPSYKVLLLVIVSLVASLEFNDGKATAANATARMIIIIIKIAIIFLFSIRILPILSIL